MSRRSGISLFFLIFVGASLAAQSPPPRPVHPPHPAKWEPKPQQVLVSYWTVEPNWTTQLEIRNNVAWRDVTITPVLKTGAGREIPLKPVTVAPEEVATVDVREALAIAAPELVDRPDSFGSTVYRFEADSDSNIFVANMVQRTGTPIGFHFDEEWTDASQATGSQESIWWLPRATASDWLILTNASNRPLVTSLAVSDIAGRSVRQRVNLGPGETQRLDLRALTRAGGLGGLEGGVTVAAVSGAGALITSHIVFDESAGMSAAMKTFERDPAEKPTSHTMRAPMMALAMPDPALQFPVGTALVRNCSCATLPQRR